MSFLLAPKQTVRTPPKARTSPHPRVPHTQPGKYIFYILNEKFDVSEVVLLYYSKLGFLTLVKQAFH